MSGDFTMNLLHDVVQKEIDRLKGEGKSDVEIEEKFSNIDLEGVLTKLTETMASDTVDVIENTMYERVLQERTNTS